MKNKCRRVSQKQLEKAPSSREGLGSRDASSHSLGRASRPQEKGRPARASWGNSLALIMSPSDPLGLGLCHQGPTGTWFCSSCSQLADCGGSFWALSCHSWDPLHSWKPQHSASHPRPFATGLGAP